MYNCGNLFTVVSKQSRNPWHDPRHVFFYFPSFLQPRNKFYFQYWNCKKKFNVLCSSPYVFLFAQCPNTLRWWLTDTAATFRIRRTLPRVETLKFSILHFTLPPSFEQPSQARGWKENVIVESKHGRFKMENVAIKSSGPFSGTWPTIKSDPVRDWSKEREGERPGAPHSQFHIGLVVEFCE